MPATRIGWLRLIGAAESASYILLVGVAMPLKYLAGMPIAVRVAGSVHGALFVAFCFALLFVMLRHRWSLFKGAKYFLASLVPFGPLLLDKELAREDAATREGAR